MLLRRLPPLALVSSTLLLAACTTPLPAGPLQPFRSDGCSLFPDRSHLLAADWCACCVAHDLAYWRGGTAQQRAQADTDLKACVSQASGNPLLGPLMYAGVRLGGLPDWRTPFRWGYGWPQQRAYGPLSDAEQRQAEALTPSSWAPVIRQACPATVAPNPP